MKDILTEIIDMNIEHKKKQVEYIIKEIEKEQEREELEICLSLH